MIFYFPDSCNGDENLKHKFMKAEAGISKCISCGMFLTQYQYEKEKIEMERWLEKQRKLQESNK